MTNDDPKSAEAIAKPKVTESKLSLQTTGNISVEALYAKDILKIPGSITASGQGAVTHSLPVYDEILGVWNMFEQPKFTLTTIPKPNSFTGRIGDNFDCDCTHDPLYSFIENNNISLFPDIQRLELTNIPMVVLNPASGMKINDIKYQIVYDNLDFIEGDTITNKYDLKGNMLPGEFKYFETITEDVFLAPNPISANYTTISYPWWDFTQSNPIYSQNTAVCNKFIRQHFYDTEQTSREAFIETLGLQLDQLDKAGGWNKAILSTPYMSQNCIESPEIFSYSKISNPRLRVRVALEPIINNPDSEVDEVIMIHTFPGDITNITNNQPYIIHGTPNLDMNELGLYGYQPVSIEMPTGINFNFDGYSANSILKNEIISEDLKVRGDLHIFEGVTFAIGNHIISATDNIYIHNSIEQINPSSIINFQAGKELFVLPEAIISPEITLEIEPNRVEPCGVQKETYPTSLQIVSFCNGEIYNNVSKPIEKLYLMDETTQVNSLPIFKIENEFEVSLFPNPTKNHTTVELSRSVYGASVAVYDLMGRNVNVPITESGLRYDLDVSNLNTGSYLVKVSTSEGTVTKNLVIQ